ncbi:MAG: hypothetical protein WB424_10725 [Terracidiphilus sp.]
MRTNVNLADDARQFAEVYAHASKITLGEAIIELIRKNIPAASGASEAPMFCRSASGFPTFSPSGRVITTKMVLEAQNEESI